MKQLAFILIAVCSLSIVSCKKTVIKGHGTTVSETRYLPSFSSIECNGDIHLEIYPSDEDRVVVTGYENLIPEFETNVHNGKLRLEYNDRYFSVRKDNIRLKLYTTGFSNISSNGSGDIFINDNIDTKSLSIQLNGSGNVNASRNDVDYFSTEVNGSGNINTREVHAQTAYAKISGSGNIDITVEEFLDAKISGSGNIDYWGDPSSVNVDITGSGKVRKH